MFLLDMLVSPFAVLLYPPVAAVVGILIAIIIIVFIIRNKRR